MPGPGYHGRTHARGGSDPIPGFAAWAQVYLDLTPQTIPALSTALLSWEHFQTNAPSLFSTLPSGVAGDQQIVCAEYGVYLAVASVEWEAGTYRRSCFISRTRQLGTHLGSYGQAAATASDEFDVGDVSLGIHEWWDYLPTQPAGWQVSVSNGDSVDRDVTRARLSVTWLPGSIRKANYSVY